MHSTVFERQAPARSVVAHALAPARRSVFWVDDIAGDRREALSSAVEADLAIVGGGYTGLWTALLATQRDPDLRVVLLEGRRVGWAASGRNGGFCEASLTHGRENGERRWPEEVDRLDRLGRQNLDEIEQTIERFGLDVDAEHTGVLTVAVEAHQIPWLRERELGDRNVILDRAGVQAQVASPTYLAGRWDKGTNLLVHPAKLASELARVAAERGVTIFEQSPVRQLDDAGTHVELRTDLATVRARRVVLGTNVFPSLLRRNRLMTVPVYDYVLATEPLTAEQMRSLGWADRQGISDLANQFHYYRLTADNRIVFGGYDAIYHAGRRVRAEYEDRPESYARLASHFFTTFPQLEGVRFSHRWAGAIDTCTRFCAFYGTARGGKVAYAAGFTGLGVGATRFAADVMLDLLDGAATERTELAMVRSRPAPFPPEPFASLGINLTRWSLDRADHRQGRRNPWLKALDALGLGFDS